MALVATTPEAFEAALAPFKEAVPDGEAYERLCTLAIDHPAVARLNRLDPFSADYRSLAMELYRDVGRRADNYEPARDEQMPTEMPANIWTEQVPWSFRRSGLIAEFFTSWGQIFSLLDLPDGGRVLEYGCATGQLLLWLSRSGFDAHGVDINPDALAIARRQAELMGLPVKLDVGAFGEGFAGERFDRIIFFEAFHHAWEFDRLLVRLHERLAPGGRVIFCGEPIVHELMPGVPFPWGPRLDALSIFCMRRWGWMELGFQHQFFMQMLERTGWRATFHPVAGCGRAAAYVAVPGENQAAPSPAAGGPVVDGGMVRRVLPEPARSFMRRGLRKIARMLD